MSGLGKAISIFSVFGAGTHSDQAVSVVSKTYHSGMSGIWYQWLYLFVTPFNWWIAPILRRCRAITTADFFEARYDRVEYKAFPGAMVSLFDLDERPTP